MVDFSGKTAFRRSEGITRWEMYAEEKSSACIGTVIRSMNGGLPVKLVVLIRNYGAVGERFFLKIS